MRAIGFCVRLFEGGTRERVRAERALVYLLTALYKIDCDFLRDYPDTPTIEEARILGLVHYVPERNGEVFKDIPCILDQGYEDCDGLAAWKAAELTVRDRRPARPVLKRSRMEGKTLIYHTVARELRTGRIHDPSVLLGMRKFEAALRGPVVGKMPVPAWAQ